MTRTEPPAPSWRLAANAAPPRSAWRPMSVRIHSTFALVAAALLALAVAACGPASTSAPIGSPSASSPGPTTAPSSPPSTDLAPSPTLATLLLKVTTEGGFINPASTLATLPTVAVYADGRIFVPGTDPAGGSGLVAPLTVRYVGSTGSAEILAAIQRGLDLSPQDIRLPPDGRR